VRTVLSLCDVSAVMVRPWHAAGFRCYCVDVRHPAGETEVEPGLVLVGADVRHYLPPREDLAIVFAFPPCTHLAVSGARWFAAKGLRGLIDGLELVERCRAVCEWAGSPWMLENPVSTIATYWRPPDHTFDPCDYAGYEGGADDLYTKRTCLWTGGGFRMPPVRRRPPTDGSRMHLLPPSDDRAAIRSQTPAGFARAVFEANANRPAYTLFPA